MFCLHGLHTTHIPVYVWCLQRSEEGIRFFGTGVLNGCEWLRECSELNLGPLEEQQVFLTTESTLQHMPDFLHGLFGSRSRPHACPASILLIELSFSTASVSFIFLFFWKRSTNTEQGMSSILLQHEKHKEVMSHLHIRTITPWAEPTCSTLTARHNAYEK